MRINKYLANCGLASRRHCEQIILDGRVKKNGKLLTNLSTDISDTDIITVDGNIVKPIENHIYLMINKPKGYITTTSDEHGRKTVMELIKDSKYKDKRLFPVGRLDYDTEGLLFLTTDGDFSNKLTHPRNEINKTYIAKIEGQVTEDELNKLRRGVTLDGVKTKKCRLKLVDFTDNISRIEVVISEGKNRQVRRMFESINREVIFLKRVAIGDIKLGGLYRGNYRELKPQEIAYLKR